MQQASGVKDFQDYTGAMPGAFRMSNQFEVSSSEDGGVKRQSDFSASEFSAEVRRINFDQDTMFGNGLPTG